jgi:hypothetical protein
MLINRKTIAMVVCMAVTACLSLAAAADDKAKYVGTYYTDNGQTVTINSDGTQTTVPATMFSLFQNSGTVRRSTPAQGVWREVGKNEIQITNIRFWTDALGNDYRPDGTIFKATFRAVFDQPERHSLFGPVETSIGFTVEANSILYEFFTPDQNPITDEPNSVIPDTGAGYKAYRLRTVQPGS